MDLQGQFNACYLQDLRQLTAKCRRSAADYCALQYEATLRDADCAGLRKMNARPRASKSNQKTYFTSDLPNKIRATRQSATLRNPRRTVRPFAHGKLTPPSSSRWRRAPAKFAVYLRALSAARLEIADEHDFHVRPHLRERSLFGDIAHQALRIGEGIVAKRDDDAFWPRVDLFDMRLAGTEP